MIPTSLYLLDILTHEQNDILNLIDLKLNYYKTHPLYDLYTKDTLKMHFTDLRNTIDNNLFNFQKEYNEATIINNTEIENNLINKNIKNNTSNIEFDINKEENKQEEDFISIKQQTTYKETEFDDQNTIFSKNLILPKQSKKIQSEV